MICFCVKQPLCRRPRHLFGKYDGSQSTWCISGHMNTTHHSINIQQNNIRKRNSLWSLPNSITDRLIEKFLHLHLTANQLPVLLSFASKCEYKNHWNSVCSTDLRLIIYIFHTTWFSNGESYVKFASQMIDVWGRNVHYSKSMKILIQFDWWHVVENSEKYWEKNFIVLFTRSLPILIRVEIIFALKSIEKLN